MADMSSRPVDPRFQALLDKAAALHERADALRRDLTLPSDEQVDAQNQASARRVRASLVKLLLNR